MQNSWMQPYPCITSIIILRKYLSFRLFQTYYSTHTLYKIKSHFCNLLHFDRLLSSSYGLLLWRIHTTLERKVIFSLPVNAIPSTILMLFWLSGSYYYSLSSYQCLMSRIIISSCSLRRSCSGSPLLSARQRHFR